MGFAMVSAIALLPLPIFAFSSAHATEQSEPSEADAAEIEKRRDQNREELQDLVDTIGLSEDKMRQLEESMAALQEDSVRIRDELIASAARRRDLETKISDSEQTLAKLTLREDQVKASLLAKRDTLAEVLAALQRMGRNPPPALLVSPEDALGSVRSAILLGAVVPGLRGEAERLVASLQEFTEVRAAVALEKQRLAVMMTGSLEEQKRLDLLLAENQKKNSQSVAELSAEKKRSEELAAKATSLESLVLSLESEIASVREANERAIQEQQRLASLPQADKDQRRADAEAGTPDKNRITPAYPFSTLKGKLALPVTGEIAKRFGEPDGTGHFLKGQLVLTAADALVTAPVDGIVVYAGEFRSYGRMVILDAGEGYHIVMTGLDTIRTRQGTFVFSGEPIASMGAKRVASATALSLETERPTLYIEFRKDGVPVDSKSWWTAENTGKARNDS
jgi:septal ring factor EnvC (AmiA/AmiB activator)